MPSAIPAPGAPFPISNDMKVIALALLNACLLTGGVFFQKLNVTRGGSPFWSPWLLGAAACLAPTFFIGNIAFSLGGRVGVFVPVTAFAYVMVAIMGSVAFGEPLTPPQLLGLALIVAGVALVASSSAPEI